MTAEDIKAVIKEVLAEQRLATQPDLDKVVTKTISSLLATFGIDEEDRRELKDDFAHLRRSRKSFEQAQAYTWKIVITTVVTGFLGALWLGFQAMLHK